MGCYSITGYSPAFYLVDPTIHRYPFIHLGGERPCAQRNLSKGSNLKPSTSSRSALVLLMQSSGNLSIQGVPLSKFGQREIYHGTYICSKSEHERHSPSMIKDSCSNELRFRFTLFNKWTPALINHLKFVITLAK